MSNFAASCRPPEPGATRLMRPPASPDDFLIVRRHAVTRQDNGTFPAMRNPVRATAGAGFATERGVTRGPDEARLPARTPDCMRRVPARRGHALPGAERRRHRR